MPTILNQEAAIRHLFDQGGLDITPFEQEIILPEPAPTTEDGPLEVRGHLLKEVQAYIDTLTPKQRAQGDLPQSGNVYFITDDATNSAPTEAEKQMLDHNQSQHMFIEPRLYTPTANRYEVLPDGSFGQMVASWPDHRVFGRGVKDSQVLGFVMQRVEENKNTNPDQQFPS